MLSGEERKCYLLVAGMGITNIADIIFIIGGTGTMRIYRAPPFTGGG
jgi:hypothetical protein